jgi:hypothetical protein
MRVAYIVLAHTAPGQLSRLVDRLDGTHASFLIHVDKRAAIYERVHGALARNERVTFLPRVTSRLATFGLVAPPLDALSTLFRRQDPFDYAILLSGQDYPIKPQHALLGRLVEEASACFLHAFPIDDLDLSEWPPQATFRYEHWHTHVGDRGWSIPMRRRVPGGRRPFGGSMFWAIPRDAAAYVLDTLEREPNLLRFFKHTHVPEEMFFQTILMNSPFRERVATLAAPQCYGLHFIDWRARDDHPHTLRLRHLSELRSTPAFFARKFDEGVDGLVLDRIDAELLGQADGRMTEAR